MNAQEADLQRRFAGLQRLYGAEGAAAIRAAHVAVIGIGGVGSWTAEALARSAVGRITLIDFDHIAESNLNRQIHAVSATIGQAKVQAMRERIAQINPHCKVSGVDDFVDADNWPQILPQPVSAVVDACDQTRAKLAMAAWARRHPHIHFITAGAAGGKQQAHLVDVDDLARATHDPLLAQLRQRLRKEHGAPQHDRKMGLTCVFSREPVARPVVCEAMVQDDAAPGEPLDNSLNCHGYGSSVAVTATFGMCAAGWVLQKLACGSSG